MGRSYDDWKTTEPDDPEPPSVRCPDCDAVVTEDDCICPFCDYLILPPWNEPDRLHEDGEQ